MTEDEEYKAIKALPGYLGTVASADDWPFVWAKLQEAGNEEGLTEEQARKRYLAALATAEALYAKQEK